MFVKVQKWENSKEIRLSNEVLAEANILVGDELEIISDKNTLVIKPVHKIRGKYRIQDLVAQIPHNYQAKEENWGSPIGQEFW